METADGPLCLPAENTQIHGLEIHGKGKKNPKQPPRYTEQANVAHIPHPAAGTLRAVCAGTWAAPALGREQPIAPLWDFTLLL